MYKAFFGFEFDTIEKVNEFNTGCHICFSGCRDKNDPPDTYCNNCALINECITCNHDME